MTRHLMRWARGFVDFLRRQRLYAVMVLGTTLLAAFYYFVICSDRYVSHAKVRVEQESDSQMPALELGIMSLGGTSSSMLDAELLKRFIESPAMLAYLDQTLKLREHYAQDGVDLISRLPRDASRESFLSYYLGRISVSVDEGAHLLDLDVQAFDPVYAQRLCEAIVRRAEMFINDISQTLAREQVAFVQGELEEANERLNRASEAMVALQAQHKVLSPAVETQVVGQIIAGLEQELAQRRAELTALLSYLSPRAPEVLAARKTIAALEAQIAQERARQVGGELGSALNELQLQFREQQMELQLATDLYRTNLATLESAKLDASKKVKYLVLISPPTLPDSSEEPRRGYILLTLFVILNVLFLITTLVIATIKDHRD